VTLEGQNIELKPVAPEYAEAIVEAGRGLDWAWMSARLVDLDSVRSWIEATLTLQERGEEYTFVVRELATEKIVGSTRYMDTQPKNKGTEIGWTWYSPRVWGTVVNPECKFLLLRHAFEDWGAIRVQLKTDDKNIHSQRAILKLGAKFEGRLRNHRFRFDGTIRDTMMYSITREEWPEVKASLQRRIELSKN
jgi:N-acetyltransferase